MTAIDIRKKKKKEDSSRSSGGRNKNIELDYIERSFLTRTDVCEWVGV